MPWLTIIQILLVILWYTVDAMKDLPAWLVFIPAAVIAVRVVLVTIFLGVVAWAQSS